MIDPQAAALFDQALRDAGIPIFGVAIMNDTGFVDPTWPPEWEVVARRDNLVVRIDYNNASAAQITQGNSIVFNLDVTWMQPRNVWTIYDDIKALTSAQQANINTDIMANNYARARALRPPQDGPALSLQWGSVLGTATAPERRDTLLRIAAMVCQQEPTYLEHPAFDSSINISGDEPVP